MRGHRSHLTTYLELFESAPFSLTYSVPPQLNRLITKLPGLPHDSLRKILVENTLIPLFQIFSGVRFTELDSTDMSSLGLSTIPRRAVGGAGTTRLCPDCVIDDFHEVGAPYIHRTHQVPGVLVCWKHGSSLHGHCSYCGCPFEREKELFSVPWKNCICGRPLTSMHKVAPAPQSSDVVHAFANFTRELLTRSVDELDASVLTDVYRQGFIDHGFTRGKSVSRRESLAAMEDFYGKELLTKMDTAYRAGRTSSFFHHLIKCATFDMPLSRHLISAFFLFRKADEFWSAVDFAKKRAAAEPILMARKRNTSRNAILGQRTHPKTTSVPAELAQLVDKLYEIQATNPAYKLDDYWKKHYGLMKRLLRAEPAIFDDFKLKLTSDTPSSETNHSKKSRHYEKDKALAWGIEQAAVDFYLSLEKPRKATRYALLKAVGSKYPDPANFPLTAKALEECSESTWHFNARRVLWAILMIREVAPLDSKINQLAGVNHYSGIALIEYFNVRGSEKVFGNESIQQILTQKGIKRNWSGPFPDTEFHPVGRAYDRHIPPPQLGKKKTLNNPPLSNGVGNQTRVDRTTKKNSSMCPSTSFGSATESNYVTPRRSLATG